MGLEVSLVCRNGRVIEPELLPSADQGAARANLRDLTRINAWLGGHRILTRLFRPLVSPRERFSVLDVGAASGDMGVAIGRRYPNAAVTSLDLCPPHLGLAPAPRLAADAFHLPFRPGAFDFVTCSLLLHHFREGEAVELVRRLRAVARRALLILDLERHPLPYYFLPATRWLLRWHEVTVHDGCVSVAAGFHLRELAALARQAGASRPLVRRHRPWFRVSLVLPVL
jgi:SAM-dependent methyltransferase